MHAARIGIKIVTLACPRKNGRACLPFARSFFLAPTTAKRLLRRLCYPGVYSSPKKDGVAYRTD